VTAASVSVGADQMQYYDVEVDLEALRKLAVNHSEWTVLGESIACYQAKVTRAAYIIAWVACAESSCPTP
jgi:hypothetical protein